MDMGDGPKYSLGRSGKGKLPVNWEDLDEETRKNISESLASVRQRLSEEIQSLGIAMDIVMRPVAEQWSGFISQLAPVAESFGELTAFMRRWVPNWSRDVDPERAWDVTAEGIPLAFVPRESIVDELLAADDRDARVTIILRSKILILADCRWALQPDDENPLPASIAMLPRLLVEAIEVLDLGHVAAACTLSCSIIDSALRRTEPKQLDYKKLHKRSAATDLQQAIAGNDFRVSLAMRPMHSLMVEWWPSMQAPMPKMPSRHVVTHWLDPEHLTESNALIIVMAATSLLLGLAERETVGAALAAQAD
jgi:hypothetical protein